MKAEYRNIFRELGISQEEIDRRVNESFETIFNGPEGIRLYHPVGEDTGYMEDTGNIDARTEGMSYGMMMAVQMDRKDIFDTIWRWSLSNMYMTEGHNQGYFAWSCSPDGKHNAEGPAPDGEEYYAMALFFASHRWSDGEGELNYSGWAKTILRDCIHRNGANEKPGGTMWDLDNYLIKFVPGVDFTDPSYHLPHFYELFSLWSDEEDREFWAKAASSSREFLHSACHIKTGLCTDYSKYSGEPLDELRWNRMHSRYYSDSYRTVMNISLDSEWFGKDPWQAENNARLQSFYSSVGELWDRVYEKDGSMVDELVMHPVAVIASNAAASLAVFNGDDENAKKLAAEFVYKLWNTPLREGKRRYYDNCLYFFALLMLSGKYRIW